MYPHMAYISMHMRHLVFCERKNPPNIEPWVRNWWFFCQLPADMPEVGTLSCVILLCTVNRLSIWNLNTDRNSNAGRVKAVWSCCRRTQLQGTNSEDYPIMASHMFPLGPDFMLNCASKQDTKSKNEFYWLICRSSVVSHLQPIIHRCVLHGYLMESLMSSPPPKKNHRKFQSMVRKMHEQTLDYPIISIDR